MNIKNVNHLIKLRRFGLPLNKVLIVGSGTMALFGIKKNDDLDLWVTNDAYKMMGKNKNFKPVKKHGRVFYESLDGSIEASNEMPCTKGRVEDYLKRAILLYGYHFKSLNDVLDWKKCMKRPKDKEHIKLIEKYKKSEVVEAYLNTLQTLHEAKQPLVMYHASSHQNLKSIKIKDAEKQSQRGLKRLIWGTPDREYASMFCIPATSSLGFKKGIYAGDKHRTFEVPKKYKSWLNRPCSIYEVNPTPFKKEAGRKTPDWISNKDVKVLKEVKYKTAKECLLDNNVKIKII